MRTNNLKAAGDSDLSLAAMRFLTDCAGEWRVWGASLKGFPPERVKENRELFAKHAPLLTEKIVLNASAYRQLAMKIPLITKPVRLGGSEKNW